MFPSMSRSKGNFGNLTEYNKRNIFLRNHAENVVGRLVLDLFLFFKKSLNEIKASGLQLSFNIFIALKLKTNCIKL